MKIYNFLRKIDAIALNNSKWLNMAFKICKSKERSKDLVQDMYISLIKSNTVIKNEGSFIYVTLKRLFLQEERRLYLDRKNLKDRVTFINIDDVEL